MFNYSDDGEVTIPNIKVPDTITSWVTTGFALNKKYGLGVAPSPAKVR